MMRYCCTGPSCHACPGCGPTSRNPGLSIRADRRGQPVHSGLGDQPEHQRHQQQRGERRGPRWTAVRLSGTTSRASGRRTREPPGPRYSAPTRASPLMNRPELERDGEGVAQQPGRDREAAGPEVQQEGRRDRRAPGATARTAARPRRRTTWCRRAAAGGRRWRSPSSSRCAAARPAQQDAGDEVGERRDAGGRRDPGGRTSSRHRRARSIRGAGGGSGGPTQPVRAAAAGGRASGRPRSPPGPGPGRAGGPRPGPSAGGSGSTSVGRTSVTVVRLGPAAARRPARRSPAAS